MPPSATNPTSLKWQLLQSKLLVVIILLLILGVFFRLYHLDRKIYWHDEVLTSARVGGHQRQTYIENALAACFFFILQKGYSRD
ncbi:hypothetical protein C1752_01475 [Acaryochloris thomasi RCC1774]|uniref:Uncharacterized protein n=1 Tax=Acaryochloris thomasi RCC1774 TaxID=1764569 RepID=A0A2W1JM72_9CYAN|nr:hypothetical protein [Acaryochloris thomasi]PZD74418.1 hypothetical protein C1752_01475 [Acaryochloris thomasi RCC1774]